MNTWPRDLKMDFKVGNCLSGAVKFNKNADPDKYKYSAYVIGFAASSQFYLLISEWGESVVIFGVENS